MKKKNIIFMLFGLSASFASWAQEPMDVVRQPQIEMNRSRSLWFGSSNVAGMSINPLDKYSIVSLGYSMTDGDFRMTQEGEKKSVVGFNTNGSANVGKTYLWGEFNYGNIVEKDTKFLTNIYDPFRDMPYYVADNVASKFKKQAYDLRVKAAFPQLWDFVTAGMDLQYTTRTGAKQRDPRSVTYYLTVSATPSFLFELSGKSHLGVSLNYEYLYERSTFNRSDTEVDCPVYIMRGLGNYTPAVVSGSVGIGTFFYKGNRIGGGLQYGYNGGGSFSAMVDATYSYKVEDAFQTPTKKQNMGSTKQDLWNVKVQLLNNGESFMHKLSLGFVNKNTKGIEYIQEMEQSFEISKWVTLAKYIRSEYSYTGITANYELYAKDGNAYNWRAGADIEYTNKDDKYLLPQSTLNAENMLVNLYGKKNFALCDKSSLLAGINAGYNANINGEYNYNGTYSESDVVKEMYAKDIMYMSSDYVKVGAEVVFSTLVAPRTSFFVKAQCEYYAPDSKVFDNRVYTDFSVGITF